MVILSFGNEIFKFKLHCDQAKKYSLLKESKFYANIHSMR